MTKKIISKMFSSVITKILKQKFSTKNLVTFKRWDGVKRSLKRVTGKSDFYGGFAENQCLEGIA